MIDRHYPALSQAVAHSWLWRTGASAAGALGRAWPGSLTSALIGTAARLRSVASIAAMVAVAAVVALAAQFATPVYVRSGLPVMWALAAIAALIVVALSASAFERAWPHSTAARLLAPRHVR